MLISYSKRFLSYFAYMNYLLKLLIWVLRFLESWSIVVIIIVMILVFSINSHSLRRRSYIIEIIIALFQLGLVILHLAYFLKQLDYFKAIIECNSNQNQLLISILHKYFQHLVFQMSWLFINRIVNVILLEEFTQIQEWKVIFLQIIIKYATYYLSNRFPKLQC